MIITVLSLALFATLAAVAVRRAPGDARENVRVAWYQLTEVYGLPTKVKVLIGFYQIATRVPAIYDVILPEEIRAMLLTLQFAISFGIEGMPLTGRK